MPAHTPGEKKKKIAKNPPVKKPPATKPPARKPR